MARPRIGHPRRVFLPKVPAMRHTRTGWASQTRWDLGRYRRKRFLEGSQLRTRYASATTSLDLAADALEDWSRWRARSDVPDALHPELRLALVCLSHTRRLSALVETCTALHLKGQLTIKFRIGALASQESKNLDFSMVLTCSCSDVPMPDAGLDKFCQSGSKLLPIDNSPVSCSE